jgi:hypothetical protein
MNAVVIYESLTGNTRGAAALIVEELAKAGVTATACPITRIDFQALSNAKLVIVGTWTDGLVLFGQRPGRAGRVRQLPAIDGKLAAVYVTYAIDSGKALNKLEKIVRQRGGDVLGGMTIKRNDLAGGAKEFVGRLFDALEDRHVEIA